MSAVNACLFPRAALLPPRDKTEGRENKTDKETEREGKKQAAQVSYVTVNM